jgi:hypothetical protein
MLKCPLQRASSFGLLCEPILSVPQNIAVPLTLDVLRKSKDHCYWNDHGFFEVIATAAAGAIRGAPGFQSGQYVLHECGLASFGARSGTVSCHGL